MLINPLNSLPWVINGVIQAWVSIKRVERYLELPNLNWIDYYTFNEFDLFSASTSAGSAAGKNSSDTIIEFKNANFSWKSSTSTRSIERIDESQGLIEQTPNLHDISFKIQRGQLVGIIGKVGSGKSSLLHAILAEMEKFEDNGRVRIDSSICAEVCKAFNRNSFKVVKFKSK